ncbi:hypothetical protein CPB83DRAFT_840676 [Crepidotus variabilis]|uniref:DUF6533 domain-containing protein n=1 Tax=Crepidotus variabilis TaxID=179855 RepID=A0A9P6E427_9AGAR|nr:hypothetical protein CPB83DRAFT_840676 [Crepidotus variabilis]
MSISALNTATTALVVKYNIQFASIALLYYDYSLTWSREIQFFWLRKPSLSTVLYFCCRYALISNVIYAFAMAGKIKFMRIQCPEYFLYYIRVFLIDKMSEVVWGARTYAVFDRNKVVLGLLAAIGTVVALLSVQNHTRWIPPQLLPIMTATFEILAAILTTVQICKMIRLTRSDGPKRRGLAQLVLEQGTLYIVFVSLFSVGTILLLNIKATKGTPFEKLLNALNIPFLLNLREWENASVSAYSESKVLDSISMPLGFEEALHVLEEVDDHASDNHSSWSEEMRRDPLLRNPNEEVLHIAPPPVGSDRV